MKRKSTLLVRFAVRGLMMLGFAFAMFTEVQAQALQVNLPGNYSLCSGGSVPLSPQVSGGAGSYTYTWAPATGLSCTTCPNPIASPQQTTDYTLTVRDLENTEASAMTTVLVSPTATLQVAPAATSVCAGAFVVLTATPSGGSGTCTYRWQIATGPNGPWLDMSSNWNGPELYPATLGWTIGTTHYYRAIYTCSGSLCATATSDPVSVSVAAIPAVSISPATNFVCQNEPLTLQATVSGGTGNCDIQWLSGPTTSGPWTPVPGAIGATYLPPTDLPGTMYYTASYGCNGTNCGSIIAGQPAKVVTLTPASISVSANDSIVCVGGTPLLTAQLQNGSPECPLQWQRSKFADGPWINISQANQLTYQVPAGNPDTSFYRVVYACLPGPVNTSGITMTIGSASNVAQGQQVCLDVRVQNFNNIVGMQFSMQYNPAMLHFTSVANFGLPGLTAGGNFGLPLAGAAGITAPGTITLTWTDTDWSGETLPNGTTLFTLCFNALANTSAASVAFTLTP
ncbi:MAG TPA: cohesin domain-containing protein, partial [Saprospiraceae bacterium]|nr:cohesin domain-containing protein [Saprospiraceae bacterium]